MLERKLEPRNERSGERTVYKQHRGRTKLNFDSENVVKVVREREREREK